MANANLDRLTGLAPELHCMIAKFTVRDDLKSLRQVSKCWNDAATPVLFREFAFRMHTTPEEWSKRIRFEKGAFVKTFTVTTIVYERLNFGEYKARRLPNNIRHASSNVQHSLEHPKQEFASYKQCRDDHMELLAERHCLAYLTVLLDSMKNLQKVKLTGDYLAVNQRNPSLAMGLKSGLADMGKSHLHVLLSALAAARSPLSELTVHGLGEDRLRYKAFNVPATHGNLTVFSKLTVLDLTFIHGFYDNLQVPAPTNVNPEGISFVARTLSCAINLLHLTLTLDHDSGFNNVASNDLHLVLHGCRLPKLLTCKLWCSIISYTILANFIRGSPSLSQLTIWETKTDPNTLHGIHAALRKEFPQLTLEINGIRAVGTPET
ncbi:MAG: hypothetical protein LQ339_001655 [Xanthoria mediterranea]|nr:MAG: hypothetical protein LQ339_001655 [Xanthoria mediterranea]